MFLLAVSSSGDLHSIMFWLMGDLSLARGRDILSVGAALVVGFSVLCLYARPLNLIVTGEETARTLGVDPATAKRVLLIVTSLMTGLAVSVSGTIGFVGLMVPHLMRMALGPDHRLLLPASLFFGAAFLILADTLARTLLAPMELPVGVVTALCGAPYFIYLLRRMSD
jgi:iron complex transport system permease protein